MSGQTALLLWIGLQLVLLGPWAIYLLDKILAELRRINRKDGD